MVDAACRQLVVGSRRTHVVVDRVGKVDRRPVRDGSVVSAVIAVLMWMVVLRVPVYIRHDVIDSWWFSL